MDESNKDKFEEMQPFSKDLIFRINPNEEM